MIHGFDDSTKEKVSLSNAVFIEQISKTFTDTVAAGAFKSFTIPKSLYEKSNATFLGVTMIYQSSHLALIGIYTSSEGIVISVTNTSAYDISSPQFNLKGLYVKNE